MRPIFALLVALLFVGGCASTQVQTYSKPASADRSFGNIKRIAILPFDTLTEAGVGPKNAENMLVQQVLALQIFDHVKEPRYVSALMKKLKLRNAESLDREIVQKIGQELQVDAIMVGALLLFGQDEKSEIVEFSVYLNMLDVSTGEIIWSGSNFVRSSTTWAQVFGLSQGPAVNELANKGILQLADELADAFASARDTENQLLMQQAEEMSEGEDDEDAAKPAPEEKQSDELLLKVKPK